MLVVDKAGLTGPFSNGKYVVSNWLRGRVISGYLSDDAIGDWHYADLFDCLADQCLAERFTWLNMASRETPKVRICFAMMATPREQDASLLYEKGIDDIRHADNLDLLSLTQPER
jgi:hypothetical protein